jgi:hypothetical protein
MRDILLITIKLTIFLSSSNLLALDRINTSEVYWKSDKAQSQKISDTQYRLTTTAMLRDNDPYDKARVVTINPAYPIMKTNSSLFDSLYALGIREMEKNSVDRITDSAFSSSECHCFETGKKWNYVWTRDISYSAHLALASLDQKRTLESLLFKVSNRRYQGSDSAEIVQDTGTGGSWPVSTDRVVWALAARELLTYLTGVEREKFLKTAFHALKNTVDNDKIAVFDQMDGLYTGEQSFLDWREQTYPNWTARNIIHVGMSKSLSTNVTHFIALETVSNMAMELGLINQFKYYHELSSNLKQSINRYFWDEDAGLYTTYITTYLDRVKVNKYDLLGTSLAVLFNVAETEKQKNTLENYPMVSAGASVVWPQDQQAAIYHNRGIWPFVTQYALLAAKKSKQAKIYNHLFDSMVRGAALNLSNMENFEYLSLGSWVDDGSLSGPVVNSQRQLWSVAGMLSTYLDGIIGRKIEGDKLSFTPFITEKIRNTILKNSNEIVLSNLKIHNKFINVIIKLPAQNNNYSNNSFYEIISKNEFKFSNLQNNSTIKINLGSLKTSNEAHKVFKINSPYNLSSKQYENLFAPKTPTLYSIKNEMDNSRLYFSFNSQRKSSINIYRNGVLIAKNIKSNNYLDTTATHIQTPCYVLESQFDSNGVKSLHSEPHCLWRADSVRNIPITDPSMNAMGKVNYQSEFDKIFLKRWGSPEDKIIFKSLTVANDGLYAIQLNYSNLGMINTGITSAVKKVEVIDDETGNIIKTKVFMMPHHVREMYWIDSNFVTIRLKKNKQYSFKISDFYNMSYFEHFNTYLYRGGRSGAYNYANIAGIKLLFLGEDFMNNFH